MRKLALAVILLLAPHAALTQVQSGTVIIFNFTKDKLVVAADSRAVYGQSNIPPDDSRCKIVAFNHKIIFTTSGVAVRLKGSSPLLDPVEGWDNADVARIAIHSTDLSGSDTQIRIQNVADNWATLLLDKWRSYYFFYPVQVRKFAEKGKGILTNGVFAEAQQGEIHWALAMVVFNDSIAGGPIARSIDAHFSECSLCGQREGHKICAMGQVEIPAHVCSRNPKFLSHIKRRHASQSKKWDADELLTAWLVNMTSVCDLTGTVGGQTDVLDLNKDGRIHWLARKENCPENQD